MTEIRNLNLVDLVSKVKGKEVSSKEITHYFIERSKKSKKLNTYITENFEKAIKMAEEFETTLQYPFYIMQQHQAFLCCHFQKKYFLYPVQLFQ